MFAAFGSAVSLIEAATTASQTKKPSADSLAALFELPQDAASDLGVSQPAGTTMQTSSLSPETLGQVFQSQSESRRQMGMPVQPDPGRQHLDRRAQLPAAADLRQCAARRARHSDCRHHR